MQHKPDTTDQTILDRIQQSVPLTAEPYGQIAASIGIATADLVRRLDRLRRPGGLIRQISAIFDARMLGYQQTLCALAVPPERLSEVGAFIASHPGVSHCYSRRHEVNLWFTLAVSPDSTLGLEGTVRAMADRVEPTRQYILPTLERYKLRVNFPQRRTPRQDQSASAGNRPKPAEDGEPTPLQVRCIRALQQDLPTQPQPFDKLAESAGVPLSRLLREAADFLRRGWMRRYAAVLYHRRAGARANVLVAWRVADGWEDQAGKWLARSPHVSHCYRRPAAEDWPRTVYTMVHALSAEQARQEVARLAQNELLLDHVQLWTQEEYKKQRIKLFTPDEAEWEHALLA
ncbi:MAG: Lrp/AsnC family transcriptional regulator [Phycisphaerae bacterium]